MMLAMRHLVLALSLYATNLLGDPSSYPVAELVHQKDESILVADLETALQSDEPLVRATAARVIAVRGLQKFLPRLRERVVSEGDAIAARELIRALALLGENADVDLAARAASKWPSDMDDALAIAVARRGGINAIDTYLATLRQTRMQNASEFFRLALWNRRDLIAIAGSHLIRANDEHGWRALLHTLLGSGVAMNSGVLAASLTSAAEDIRSTSVWFLVRAYAEEPQAIDALVQQRLSEPRSELSSDRVDFGFEILRRMLGGVKTEDPRWLRFLETKEADELLIGETAVHPFLTETEYAVRFNRCEVQARECAMPKVKPSRKAIPSQAVAAPAFDLPVVLPPGLADAVLTETRCSDEWIGVATAIVDSSGRIQSLDLAPVQTTPRCKRAIDTLLRLSLATNSSVRSPFTGPVLLARAAKTSPCLDEEPPQSDGTTVYRVGGPITAPVVLKRAEPYFPESARRSMGGGRNVLVIVEAVITKTGCVRSVRLLAQSPFPALNGAAVLALTKWKFAPGRLDGKLVDVHFNLTINFKVN